MSDAELFARYGDAWRTVAERQASDGHDVADTDEIAPYDTCRYCRNAVGWSERHDAWVTLVGANAECYGH